ncbi:DNA polymerase III subunit alpha, partial [bacterium]|nr:DNA polymerase III subunit alpha [bacterium]
MFSHLNIHSLYSRMRGLMSIHEILEEAKKAGQTHLALTDINGLWGFIHFVQAAWDLDIQPLAAVNILSAGSDIILLAENLSGYANICRIISHIHDKPDDKIEVFMNKYYEGIFILAHREEDLQILSRHISDTHLFVELRPGIQELHAHNLAIRYKLELVATGDVYFTRKEDHNSHKLLCAIDKNLTLSQLSKNDYKRDLHYFRNEKEMQALFPNSLQAINNAQYLAERCKSDWNYVNTIFPGLSLEETRHAGIILKKLVYEGAKKRYKEVTNKIRERIEYELSIIMQKGFSSYFLIVWDIVKQTRSTIGRGSGAASIVSYCLFITQVDPIRYTLHFERFIHPERVDMPDIDVDFPWDERDKILDYIFKKYGKHRSAMVASQIFLQTRSALRETAKVYGLTDEEIKSVSKRVGWHRHQKELLKWVKEDKRFRHLDMNEALENILRQSEKITGVFHVASVHPGGVIIVPDEIRKYVPVLTAPKGVQIVEWEKDQVEDSGLLKIDILGNRSLAVVRDTLKQLGLFRNKYMDYHKIQAVGDKKTEEIMKNGRTMG